MALFSTVGFQHSFQEARVLGTHVHPFNVGDGIPDGEEVSGGTNPNSADSDGDGITDYGEIYTYFGHVDPMDADSDNDGLNDYAEIVTYHTYAAPECTGAQDSDGDGLNDYAEVMTYGTNPRSVDSDGDGIDDGYEVGKGWNPLDAATATQNPDGDAFNNLTEYQWDYQPTSSNSTPPTSQKLILCPHGSNAVHHSDWDILAPGNMGAYSARIRVRPFYQSGALAEQRLYHTQSPGFYINGTAASSVASPINVPASSTAIEYTITSDATARGTNLYFRLTTTNEPTATKDSARCYYPEIEAVNFWGPGSANYVDVSYGQTNTLWVGMPANTNDCRVRMQPTQGPTHWYGIGYFHWTDWMLVKVTGSGADPVNATLNTLDWQSAYGVWYNDITTRGIRLDPGSYTFEVGYDMNGNGALDAGEVQETCRVHVPTVDINGDYNRDKNPVDDPAETNAVTFAGPKGFVILANTDDDDGDGEPDALEDSVINTNDLADIHVFHITKLGISSNEMVSNITVTIEVLDPDTGNSSSAAYIYPKRVVGTAGGTTLNFSSPTAAATYFSGTGTAELGIEGRSFGQEVLIRSTVKHGTAVLGVDEIRVLVAPYFVAPASFDTKTLYVSTVNDTGFTNELAGICAVTNVGTTGLYIQDHVEFGYTRTGSGQSTYKAYPIILGLHQKEPSLSDQISTNVGYKFQTAHQHGGNLLVTPPTSGNDGYIVCGKELAITNFLMLQAVQTTDSGALVKLDTDWLKVPHVDNLVAFLPVGSGYKVLIADLALATNILLTTTNEVDAGTSVSASSMRSAYTNAANAANIAAMKSKLAEVESTLAASLGLSSGAFIHVPVAFRPTDSMSSQVRPYLPNLVNMQYVGNGSSARVFIPMAYYQPFEDALVAALTTAGINLSDIVVIDTYADFANGVGGDVHCISNPLMEAPSGP